MTPDLPTALRRPLRVNSRRAIRFNDDTTEWEYWSVKAQAWCYLAPPDYTPAELQIVAARSVYGCAPTDVLKLTYKFTKADARIEAEVGD